jgi:hypothetical protein
LRYYDEENRIMNFHDWVKEQEAKGAVVETLTELQRAEIGDGPWALYVYGRDGFHSGKLWFRKGKVKYPDEEITALEAKRRTEAAMRKGLEVRICNGGDMLVFHSQHGEMLYPESAEEFWKAVGVE